MLQIGHAPVNIPDWNLARERPTPGARPNEILDNPPYACCYQINLKWALDKGILIVLSTMCTHLIWSQTLNRLQSFCGWMIIVFLSSLTDVFKGKIRYLAEFLSFIFFLQNTFLCDLKCLCFVVEDMGGLTKVNWVKRRPKFHHSECKVSSDFCKLIVKHRVFSLDIHPLFISLCNVLSLINVPLSYCKRINSYYDLDCLHVFKFPLQNLFISLE